MAVLKHVAFLNFWFFWFFWFGLGWAWRLPATSQTAPQASHPITTQTPSTQPSPASQQDSQPPTQSSKPVLQPSSLSTCKPLLLLQGHETSHSKHPGAQPQTPVITKCMIYDIMCNVECNVPYMYIYWMQYMIYHIMYNIDCNVSYIIDVHMLNAIYDIRYCVQFWM